MNINDYIKLIPEEKPLDHIVTDGGMCGIFRKICCIGDSLSSGEFESLDENGNKGYHDMFEYSWGQYIARDIGAEVLNFSKGGMTASAYWNGFADQNDFWSTEKLCQAYIIALGVNDLLGLRQEIGSVSDININDCTKNSETFAGYYARIIQKIKCMRPDAFFFLMSMPRENDINDKTREKHSSLLHSLTDVFDHSYVIDLFQYAPIYDEAFKKRFYMGGHMNPAGYLLTARIVESYMDYIIRHNPQDFCQVGFIGTPYYNRDL